MSSPSAMPHSPGSAASADEPARASALDRPSLATRPSLAPRRRRRRRSRFPQHAWAVFFAVLFVPGALWLLGLLPWASRRVVAASGTGEAIGPIAALVGIAAAAGVLGWLIGWSTAVFSSLTAWIYALGGWLLVSLLGDRLDGLRPGAPLATAVDGLRRLGVEGTAAVLVLVVVGVAVGTSIARRNGRSDERAEATTGHERARRGDHLIATAPALALGAAGTWFVAIGSRGQPSGEGWGSWVLLVAGLLLAACALTAGISSFGAQLTGLLIVAVCLLHTSLLATGPAALLLDPGRSSTALADGTLLVVGIVLGMGASGAHWARRSGKRWERTEMAIAQVTRPGAEPARRAPRRTS